MAGGPRAGETVIEKYDKKIIYTFLYIIKIRQYSADSEK